MKAFAQTHLDNLEEMHRIADISGVASSDSVRFLRRELESLKAKYTSHYGADPSLAERFPLEHEKALGEIATATKKFETRKATDKEMAKRFTAAKHALRAANDFIAASKIKPSAEAEGADYPRPNETIATVGDAVDAARADIARLQEIIKVAQLAPVTKSVAMQRINSEADYIRNGLAEFSVASVTSAKGSADGLFLVRQQDETSHAPIFSDAYSLNGALHAALHLDEAVAFYTRKVEEYYAAEDTDQGLTAAERSAKIADAESNIAAAEVREEALIRLAAREFGLTICRRRDVPGAVLLGPLVEVADRPPAPPLVTANDRHPKKAVKTFFSEFVTGAPIH